jgi:hypothetical protein
MPCRSRGSDGTSPVSITRCRCWLRPPPAFGTILESRVRLAIARMHELPVAGRRFDLIVAHGIWNLAHTNGECLGSDQKIVPASPT